MTYRSTFNCALALALAFAVAGCTGTGGTNPAAGSFAATHGMTGDAPPAIDGIAGKYAGNLKDPLLGAGGAVVSLSQSASSAGGLMQIQTAKASATVSLALNVSSANAVTGTGIVVVKALPPCSIDVTATYDPKTITLQGKYTGFNNCSQTGHFKLKEDCYYDVATPVAGALKPRAFPKPC
ncbi:MAG: hypothetical protein JO029_14580 [Candidatus Eremiobacteraeota bacterium]|nr:hypothetical protein [Candidatus Eremiobacteraeota bacterium]MBV8721871.1 hypothetical protein [Candidatus Eremiobacteraeota bacterium]